MTKTLVASLFVIAFIIASVDAHAKLDTPAAWNPNPSKTSPCGGAPALPAEATWSSQKTQKLTWTTVASDGAGYICAIVTSKTTNPSINPNNCNAKTPSCTPNGKLGNGGSNVPNGAACLLTPATGSINPTTTNSVGQVQTYYLNPPAVACTDCTVAVYSSSSWFSCTSVAMGQSTKAADVEDAEDAEDAAASSGAGTTSGTTTTTGTPTSGASSETASSSASGSTSTTGTSAPVCQTSNNLQFCTMFNGVPVVAPTNGLTLEQYDALVQATYVLNLQSPLVFNNPNATNCDTTYERFICYASYEMCSKSGAVITTSACKDICTTSMNDCGGLQPVHQPLYPCNTYPSTGCNDDASVYAVNGQSLNNSASQKLPGFVALLFVVALIFIRL